MERQTQIKLELAGREIILVGTAHVSKASIEEVKRAIDEQKPDVLAVELDENRRENMENYIKRLQKLEMPVKSWHKKKALPVAP